MATFSLLIVKFISKSIGFRPLLINDINKLCYFQEKSDNRCRLYHVNKKCKL